MSKRVDLSTVGDVAVVRLKDSRLVEDPITAELAEELYEMARIGEHNKMLINFEEVTFMTSAMLNVLIALKKKAAKTNTGLSLCSISSLIMEAFGIAKLKGEFDIHANERGALAALNR